MNPSIIREILKVTERPGIVSLAGGLPAPDLFPVEAIREAATRVLRDQPMQALQYAASEGYGPLREWIAADVRRLGIPAGADQVLITTGSQQALDLAAKILIDSGSSVQVESPTYLGALQAFTPFEPRLRTIGSDAQGPLPRAMASDSAGPGARFAYLIPNFQNPTGRTITAGRRRELAAASEAGGPPIVEDNPYGELWYDEPPPGPIAALAPERTLYLGSLSKVLSPGLRLGYLIAPRDLYPKLLQAKQAADLHTAGLTQRIAAEVLGTGLLATHLPAVRDHYRRRRDAMEAALSSHLGDLAEWRKPGGGMFFWITLRAAVDTLALLPAAVAEGVAYVPGAAFLAEEAGATPEPCRSLRLIFVTASPADIAAAITTLGGLIRRAGPTGRAEA